MDAQLLRWSKNGANLVSVSLIASHSQAINFLLVDIYSSLELGTF